jgi:hypothetical protein
MHLLAAGRSVIGIRREPGPYRMNQENLLPKFNADCKSASAAILPPHSGRPEMEAAAVSPPDMAAVAAAFAGNPERVLGPGAAELGWWHRALGRLLRRGGKGRDAALEKRRPVQQQLSLDSVRVVRNDLTDCDFQVAPQRTLARPGAVKQTPAPRQPLGMVWNRLSARLLRQAAEEFSELQKQRGKLLSQAGHGRGGARGS